MLCIVVSKANKQNHFCGFENVATQSMTGIVAACTYSLTIRHTFNLMLCYVVDHNTVAGAYGAGALSTVGHTFIPMICFVVRNAAVAKENKQNHFCCFESAATQTTAGIVAACT